MQTEPPVFERLGRSQRLCDTVADILLSKILDGRLPPGMNLPSERELADQFGVSRTVIREAIGALSAKGILSVRTGSGARVAQFDGSAAAESLRLYFLNGGHQYEKVHEIRVTIETEMASLAAERRTTENLEALRAAHQEFVDLSGEDIGDEGVMAADASVRFHEMIAVSTGNELFLVILRSIQDALIEIRLANLASGMARDIVKQHRAILQAVERRDAQGANRAMRLHLVRVAAHRSRASYTNLRSPDT
jgi:GntR family transcriptional regulator, transcriptional repressor for pyruvate dehydrogenase complex